MAELGISSMSAADEGADTETIKPRPSSDVDRFCAEVQGREAFGPEGTARQITQRFMAESASGPRVRDKDHQCSAAVREEPCSVVDRHTIVSSGG